MKTRLKSAEFTISDIINTGRSKGQISASLHVDYVNRTYTISIPEIKGNDEFSLGKDFAKLIEEATKLGDEEIKKDSFL